MRTTGTVPYQQTNLNTAIIVVVSLLALDLAGHETEATKRLPVFGCHERARKINNKYE